MNKNLKKMIRDAKAGDVDAQYNLGMCYLNGDGTEANYPKAVKIFTKYAEQGNGRCQCALGMLYQNGCGVEKQANGEPEATRYTISWDVYGEFIHKQYITEREYKRLSCMSRHKLFNYVYSNYSARFPIPMPSVDTDAYYFAQYIYLMSQTIRVEDNMQQTIK